MPKKPSASTSRKCQEAINLVYEKGLSLKAAAAAVGISSQTLYSYRDDLTLAEKRLLNSISQQNSKKK